MIPNEIDGVDTTNVSMTTSSSSLLLPDYECVCASADTKCLASLPAHMLTSRRDHPTPVKRVFARLPAYNPFVGTFHYAPSAGNRGAVYFSGDIVGMNELEERKKIRHHPLTGIFHALPGYYDPLFRLHQFRNDHDDAEVTFSDSEALRSFIAVDLAEPEDCLAGVSVGYNTMTGGGGGGYANTCSGSTARPLSVVKKQHRSSNHHQSVTDLCKLEESLTRQRCFSDSDTDRVDFIKKAAKNSPPGPVSVSVVTGRHQDWRGSEDDQAYDHHEEEEEEDDHEHEHEHEHDVDIDEDGDDTGTESDSLTVRNSSEELLLLDARNAGNGGKKTGGKDKTMRRKRESSWTSSRSSGDTDSSGELLAHAAELLRDYLHPSCEFSSDEGYISTGKGIFRKCAFRTVCEADLKLRRSKSTSPTVRSPVGADVQATRERQNSFDEYTQAAPRMPLNPFVARRLMDGEELHLVNVSRGMAPNGTLSTFHTNSDEDDDDEADSTHPLPKPFFIHETAVTDHYELFGEDQLGDGSYAVVKPAISRQYGNAVAIKQIHKRYLLTKEAKQAVDREIEIHLRLRHRHIVRLYEVYETEDFLYLVLEKATKGTLKQLLTVKRRLPEACAARLAHQIVRAIFFLHESGVLHCDVKPANILLTDVKQRSPNQKEHPFGAGNDPSGTNKKKKVRSLSLDIRRTSTSTAGNGANGTATTDAMSVVLCDFGLSAKVPDVRYYKFTGDVHKVPFTGMTGTMGYMAPELLQRQHYGKAIDMWSVGIVIYEMITGYQPFYPPTACLTERPDFRDKVWSARGGLAQDLVSRLLEMDPAKRMTAQEALSHPWFDQVAFAI